MRIYKKWSSEDLCFIAENCNKMKDKELAILLSERNGCKVTVDMLRRQRRKLKIRKKRGRPYKNQDSVESKE